MSRARTSPSDVRSALRGRTNTRRAAAVQPAGDDPMRRIAALNADKRAIVVATLDFLDLFKQPKTRRQPEVTR